MTRPAGASPELTTYGSSFGSALDLTGNEFAQLIVGNDARNVINGGGGADTMYGYAGNDTYFVDNAGDIVAEAAGGGYDNVITNTSYALAAGQEIEELTTYGSATTNAINLTGNGLGQLVVGNDGVNVIDGKSGADNLYGYAGADTFAFTTALGGGNVDRLGDFQSGIDKIALDDACSPALPPARSAPARSSWGRPPATPTTASSTTAPPGRSSTMPKATAPAPPFCLRPSTPRRRSSPATSP